MAKRRPVFHCSERVSVFRVYLRELLDRRNISVWTLSKMAQRSPNCYGYLFEKRIRAIPGAVVLNDIAQLLKLSEMERQHLHYLAAYALGYDICLTTSKLQPSLFPTDNEKSSDRKNYSSSNAQSLVKG